MTALARAAGATRGRIVSALAARFRDLDLAEEACADAYLRAAETWEGAGPPRDPAAWLYRTAERFALDRMRRQKVRARLAPEPPALEPTPEEHMSDEARLIPDERLRLIFVCCHPALAADVRTPLTLKVVCGLSTPEIAAAFLVSEAALAQRLLRAKRKIAEAGIPYEVPGPAAWAERLDAVLSTLEVAYAKAHEDAAGAGPHADFARQILQLTRVLADLMPGEPAVLAFASLVRYAEARRTARLDETGAMVPVSRQDPRLWDRALIAEADGYLARAAEARPHVRVLEAAIHAAWCARPSLRQPPPWARVLTLYDTLLHFRDDPIVRLNRAVALAEVVGPDVALAAVEALPAEPMRTYIPFWAVRADLLARLNRAAEARAAYEAALALEPPPAERLWLSRQRAKLEAVRETPE